MNNIKEINLIPYVDKIGKRFNEYKNSLDKEITKLEQLIYKFNPNLEYKEQRKVIENIFKMQNKINSLKLQLEEIKQEIQLAEKTEEEIEKENKQRQITFNGMTAREWALHSRNVWNDVSSPRKDYHKEHGAVFPLKLAERLIKMYSREGDLIFDPFSGIGTTIKAALEMNRNGIGIELNPKFYELTKQILLDPKETPIIDLCTFTEENNGFIIQKNNVDDLLSLGTTSPNNNYIKLFNDDCRNLTNYLEADSVQALITSPPYADFIRKSIEDREKVHKNSLIKFNNNSTVKPYSNSDLDLGNLPYDEFLEALFPIMEDTYKVIKPGGYAIWVVKDYKDKENFSSYLDFHTDIANIGKKVGFLYHDLIIWDQNEQRSLVLLGYPSKFHTNQNCSFLVVLRKPTIDEMKQIRKDKERN
uniref:Methyltransferase n=1 Tax=Geobacillus stearothermophilus TaxID=1422 RepID=E5Q8T9_GEOSE|nr:M1.BsrI [Geobacillus stearothermophilus]